MSRGLQSDILLGGGGGGGGTVILCSIELYSNVLFVYKYSIFTISVSIVVICSLQTLSRSIIVNAAYDFYDERIMIKL